MERVFFPVVQGGRNLIMFSIQTNLNSTFVLGRLQTHNALLSQALERLSSGYRITRAADDPGGLALADKFRAQIRGWQQAARNIGLATNFVRTAEDAMTEVVNLLFDIRDLALEAANGTQSPSDRLINQSEVTQLLTEIDRLATAVKFNNFKLLNGTFSSWKPVNSLLGGGTYIGSAVFHVGANEGDKIRTSISTLSAVSLGVYALSVTTQLSASNSVLLLNSAVSRVLSRRAKIGGVERRLSSAQNIADMQVQELTTAESTIRDADIAAEIANFTRQQILVQVATAMLAQANLLPRSLLLLFDFGA